MAGLVLPLMLASDWKLRDRPVDQTVAGTADLYVLLEVSVYAATAAFLLWRYPFGLRLRRSTALMVAAWGFASMLAVSASYSPYPSLAVVRGGQMLVIAAVGSVIAGHATRAQVHRIAHAFVAAAAVGVVYGTVVPGPWEMRDGRFAWLYLHPVPAGLWLGAATVLALNYLSSHRLRDTVGWPVPVHAVLSALCVYGLVATKTRGALAGAIVGLLASAMVAARRRHRLDVVLAAGAVGGLVAMTLGSQLMTYLSRGQTADSLATLNSRTVLWTEAMSFVSEQPLYGFGIGATRGLFLDGLGLGGGHNAAINVLVDTGVVGVLVWLALLCTLLYTLLMVPRSGPAAADRALLIGLFVFFIVDSITTEQIGASANAGILWIYVMVGWASLLHRLDRQGKV